MQLEGLGASLLAASVDEEEKALEAGADVTFPIAYGVTRDQADALGAWWGEQRGGIVQPSEFLIQADGTVVHSLYASGPVGRMAGDELVRMLTLLDKREREQQ